MEIILQWEKQHVWCVKGGKSVVIALFLYFKLRDQFPDPKGLLSLAIPSQAISTTNCKVTEAGNKKRGPYNKYSPEERCQIHCRSLRLQQDRTPTEADQNVPVNVIASNTASSLVHFHFYTHRTGNPLKTFHGCPKPWNLTPLKFYTWNILTQKFSNIYGKYVW